MITAIDHLVSVYGEDSPEATASKRVFDYLIGTNPNQLQHLTFNRLRQIAQVTNDLTLMHILAVFTGPSFNLLDQHFEFLDETDDEYIDLTPEIVAESIESGIFLHPKTGESICEYQAKIYVYYGLGKSLRSAPGES